MKGMPDGASEPVLGDAMGVAMGEPSPERLGDAVGELGGESEWRSDSRASPETRRMRCIVVSIFGRSGGRWKPAGASLISRLERVGGVESSDVRHWRRIDSMASPETRRTLAPNASLAGGTRGTHSAATEAGGTLSCEVEVQRTDRATNFDLVLDREDQAGGEHMGELGEAGRLAACTLGFGPAIELRLKESLCFSC